MRTLQSVLQGGGRLTSNTTKQGDGCALRTAGDTPITQIVSRNSAVREIDMSMTRGGEEGNGMTGDLAFPRVFNLSSLSIQAGHNPPLPRKPPVPCSILSCAAPFFMTHRWSRRLLGAFARPRAAAGPSHSRAFGEGAAKPAPKTAGTFDPEILNVRAGGVSALIIYCGPAYSGRGHSFFEEGEEKGSVYPPPPPPRSGR